ncbi:MAG: polysaccharide biosynthesis protein [Nitrospirae bacterium]|nr:polysaccharide biosynthesis protein [Nitrospirota bacterium]
MLTNVILKYRRVLIVCVHLILIVVSNLLAFTLRFEWKIPPDYYYMIGATLPVIILVRLGLFYFMDLHKGLWRYASVRDVIQIFKAVIFSSAINGLIIYLVMGLHAYPRSILVMDTIFLIGLMGGVRLGTRIIREKTRLTLREDRGVFIYGAGDAGELLLRDMLKNPGYSHHVTGFIDDDDKKKGLKIHSVPVLGSGDDLPHLIKKHDPEEIIIAIPSAKPLQVQKIMGKCSKHHVALKTLPSLRDVIRGQVTVNQIRDISIEDLLFRDPVSINPENIRDLVCGKRVFVTGAAGSIGSELCRQIIKHNPRSLVLYDRNENGLYFIDHELGNKYSRDFFSVVIGDICDTNRLYMKFKKYKPEIVFHAAAYKHVPLMEDNIIESVKNNVQGTWNVMELSDQTGVETFVQISTDKAVNPTSVMGASKRIAEMAVGHMNSISSTKFIVVRFGNVLGSSGSVVPLFREQLKKGGPITVTHPDIQRFFMTIPEAVQLVLQAAAMGKGGETFVLDMGEQIKIVDLAHNLITLSGLVPEKDIKIVYTGLRPGEKLYEELFDTEENILPTSHEKINMAISGTNGIDSGKFFDQLIELQIKALGSDKEGVLSTMKDLIPTYNQTPA